MDDGESFGKDQLTIVGGRTQRPGNIWAALPWQDEAAPWVIVEWYDRVTLARTAAWPLPAGLERVRRLRAFDGRLDLSLLPDGDTARWWLIGDAGAAGVASAALAAAADFWRDQQDIGALWSPRETHALLWGRTSEDTGRKPRGLQEARVARHMRGWVETLAPAVGLDATRPVHLISRTYYALGRPQFEQYLRIEHPPAVPAVTGEAGGDVTDDAAPADGANRAAE